MYKRIKMLFMEVFNDNGAVKIEMDYEELYVCKDLVGDCKPFMVIGNVIVSKKYRS